MGKAKGGVGKKFENFVYNELKNLQRTDSFFVHRFVDSHDAGRFVSPQPSDFLLATKTVGTVYLEVKSSEIYTSLADAPIAMLRSQQIGKLTLINRAKQPIYCLFYSEVLDKVELWNLNDSIKTIAHSNHLDCRDRVMVGDIENISIMLKKAFA